jgi:hypothetical protein
MDGDENSFIRQYRPLAEQLRAIWQQSLTVLGEAVNGLDTTVVDEIEARARELFELLEDGLPGRARYDGILRAQRLAGELRPDRDALPKLQPDDDLADVLNAAWLVRLSPGFSSPDHVRRIDERARAVIDTLLQARG